MVVAADQWTQSETLLLFSDSTILHIVILGKSVIFHLICSHFAVFFLILSEQNRDLGGRMQPGEAIQMHPRLDLTILYIEYLIEPDYMLLGSWLFTLYQPWGDVGWGGVYGA